MDGVQLARRPPAAVQLGENLAVVLNGLELAAALRALLTRAGPAGQTFFRPSRQHRPRAVRRSRQQSGGIYVDATGTFFDVTVAEQF